VMKTVMRPRPAGHGLPWSGPVNGPLDTTDVSSPVTGGIAALGRAAALAEAGMGRYRGYSIAALGRAAALA
jgi:hypothetical protein